MENNRNRNFVIKNSLLSVCKARLTAEEEVFWESLFVDSIKDKYCKFAFILILLSLDDRFFLGKSQQPHVKYIYSEFKALFEDESASVLTKCASRSEIFKVKNKLIKLAKDVAESINQEIRMKVKILKKKTAGTGNNSLVIYFWFNCTSFLLEIYSIYVHIEKRILYSFYKAFEEVSSIFSDLCYLVIAKGWDFTSEIRNEVNRQSILATQWNTTSYRNTVIATIPKIFKSNYPAIKEITNTIASLYCRILDLKYVLMGLFKSFLFVMKSFYRRKDFSFLQSDNEALRSYFNAALDAVAEICDTVFFKTESDYWSICKNLKQKNIEYFKDRNVEEVIEISENSWKISGDFLGLELMSNFVIYLSWFSLLFEQPNLKDHNIFKTFYSLPVIVTQNLQDRMKVNGKKEKVIRQLKIIELIKLNIESVKAKAKYIDYMKKKVIDQDLPKEESHLYNEVVSKFADVETALYYKTNFKSIQSSDDSTLFYYKFCNLMDCVCFYEVFTPMLGSYRNLDPAILKNTTSSILGANNSIQENEDFFREQLIAGVEKQRFLNVIREIKTTAIDTTNKKFSALLCILKESGYYNRIKSQDQSLLKPTLANNVKIEVYENFFKEALDKKNNYFLDKELEDELEPICSYLRVFRDKSIVNRYELLLSANTDILFETLSKIIINSQITYTDSQ